MPFIISSMSPLSASPIVLLIAYCVIIIFVPHEKGWIWLPITPFIME